MTSYSTIIVSGEAPATTVRVLSPRLEVFEIQMTSLEDALDDIISATQGDWEAKIRVEGEGADGVVEDLRLLGFQDVGPGDTVLVRQARVV